MSVGGEDLGEHLLCNALHGGAEVTLFEAVDLRVLDLREPSLEEAHLQGLCRSKLANTVPVLRACHQLELTLGSRLVILVSTAPSAPVR